MRSHRIGIDRGKDYWKCVICGTVWISNGNPKLEHACSISKQGPGTELSESLAKWGIRACAECEHLKDVMNELGVDGCIRNIDLLVANISQRTIVPKWIIKDAIKRACDKLKKENA